MILFITAPHTFQAAFVDLEVQVQQQQQQQQSVQQSVLALQQQLSAAQVHAMLKSRLLKSHGLKRDDLSLMRAFCAG